MGAAELVCCSLRKCLAGTDLRNKQVELLRTAGLWGQGLYDFERILRSVDQQNALFSPRFPQNFGRTYGWRIYLALHIHILLMVNEQDEQARFHGEIFTGILL